MAARSRSSFVLVLLAVLIVQLRSPVAAGPALASNAAAAPTVTAVNPRSGPTTGFTGVTITGTDFVAGATVTFGGASATDVTVVNPTTMTATTPAHAAGAVDVVVTNPDMQAATLTNGYTYLPLATTERIALGLTAIGTDGGGIATRAGSGDSYEPRQWRRLPWSAYNATGKGTHVAAGDVDGDGRAEVVAGLGNGAAGWFAIVNDANAAYALIGWRQVAWATYSAGDGRTFPAVGNVDGAGGAEIVIGLAPYPNTGGWF